MIEGASEAFEVSRGNLGAGGRDAVRVDANGRRTVACE